MADLIDAAVRALKAHLAGGPLRVPDFALPIWRIFIDLHAARQVNEAGPQPITHAEIAAYAGLHRWPLAQRHVAAIRALDRAWLGHAGTGKPGAAAVSGAAINPGIFDAVFR